MIWISQQGVVACGKNGHGGYYLESSVEKDPKAPEISTPLDHWLRIPSDLLPDVECEFCVEEKARV